MLEEKRQKVWNLRCASENGERNKIIDNIEKEFSISRLLAILLYNRGYKDVESVKSFMLNDISSLNDAMALPDIDSAVERIQLAIKNNEKILIYGDYDVDGVTSVSTLFIYLKSLGADVEYYIPSRESDGYGLSSSVIHQKAAEGVMLVITVDTGITAIDEANYASQIGVDLIITDHHECPEALPNACAIINPHRVDSQYPFKKLAGVGVVFKLICALQMKIYSQCSYKASEKILNDFADLIALGTVADVMPIIGENRVIVTKGLEMISTTKRKGLFALVEKAIGNKPTGNFGNTKRITAGFVGFGIAPRINAAGRISDASIAVKLLLTEDYSEAEKLSELLCEINRTRQIEENRIAEQAYKKIKESYIPGKDYIIVIEDDGWQQGIIGIVASRITEKIGLPSILISFDSVDVGTCDPNDVGKGSGRSACGMNLVGALNYCRDYLIKYGGHALAAGLAIERKNVDAFRQKINEYAKDYFSEHNMSIQLEADYELEISDITMEFATEIMQLEPFGIGNPTPSFILNDVFLKKIIPIGNGKHLKIIVEKEGQTLSAVMFNTTLSNLGLFENERADILFNLDINEYQGIKSVQLIIQDLRQSLKTVEELAKMKTRYNEIKSGGVFDANENFIPDRNDFAAVYSTLRREFRQGRDLISEQVLLLFLREFKINYVKLQYIIRILHELKICDIQEVYEGMYQFSIKFTTEKTNIEKSSILKKLKGQCKKT